MVPSIMASRPGPEAAKQPQTSHYYHHVCWYDVFIKCCVSFIPDVTGHTPSKNLTFVSSVHRIFTQKSWG